MALPMFTVGRGIVSKAVHHDKASGNAKTGNSLLSGMMSTWYVIKQEINLVAANKQFGID